MPADTFQCPQCQAKLKYSSSLQPGTTVRCPQCQNTFPIPDPEAPAGETTQPLAPSPATGRDEVTSEPGARPRPERITDDPYEPRDQDRDRDRDRSRRYPDDDDDYPRPPRDDYGERGPDVPLSNRYEADLGKWFNIASAHYSAILGLMICFLLIWIGGEFALSFMGAILNEVTKFPFASVPLSLLLSLLLRPALMAGLVAVCLKQLDGRRWTFGDFFTGFHGRVYGKFLTVTLLYFLLAIPANIPAIGGLVVLGLRGPPELAFGLIAVALVISLVGIYFFLRLFFFVPPLILDRGFGPIEAIKGSWTLTEGHFWSLFGTYLLLALIGSVGCCACYIGGLFSIPFVALTYTACYLDIAGIDPPLPRPDSRSQWRENG